MDSTVNVWWDGDGAYYEGTVVDYNEETKKHTIAYDDGEVKEHCMELELYNVL